MKKPWKRINFVFWKKLKKHSNRFFFWKGMENHFLENGGKIFCVIRQFGNGLATCVITAPRGNKTTSDSCGYGSRIPYKMTPAVLLIKIVSLRYAN